MSSVEFRHRSPRAPGGDFRIFLGRATKRKDLRALKERRELLQRLATRGEWDVLQAIKDRAVTVEHLERLIDQHGIDDYGAHLELRPAPAAPALEVHALRFLDSVQKASTRETYRLGIAHLRAYEVDGVPLGARQWHTVRPHQIRDLRDALLSRLEPATAKTYMAAWSAFFDWAIQREESEAAEQGRAPLLEVNPVRKAKGWLAVHPTRQRFLTREEFGRLLEVAAPPMRAQWATLTLCGLRNAEFRHLPPAHVKADRIHVGPVGEWVPKNYPRSRRGVRDVPVHPRLRPLLEEHREEWAGEVTFFVNPRTGRPWIDSSLRAQFYADAAAAGLVAGTRDRDGAKPQGVGVHTCRHSFASWLAQADVQLMKIAALMGDTENTVRTYYAHHLPSDLEQSVLRLFPGGNVQPTADKTDKA